MGTAKAEKFAQRLKLALEVSGVHASLAIVANELNLNYWVRSIMLHTARNWLPAKSIRRRTNYMRWRNGCLSVRMSCDLGGLTIVPVR